MKKYIIIAVITLIFPQSTLATEVPDFSITPHNSSYENFHFAVEYINRKLMHNQFKIYTVAISITPGLRKNIDQDGYIEIWRDNTFVYSNALHPAKYNFIPLSLKKKLENENAIIFIFDINSQCISRSWFTYSIHRNDGSVKMNCVVNLKDFIPLPKNHDKSQNDNQSKESESDADFKELLKKAEHGDAKAQYNLGTLYRCGDGVIQDNKEAVKWIRKAAEQGHEEAQFFLGSAYSKGNGVVKDVNEAVKWYRIAAEQGYVPAQIFLGTLYGNDKGVFNDDKEAIKWYRKAAEQGNAAGQYMLSRAYHNGHGVTEDKIEAIKWLRKAAEQGDGAAQITLGWEYYYGYDVTKDHPEAFKWFLLAGINGYIVDDAIQTLKRTMKLSEITEGEKRAKEFVK